MKNLYLAFFLLMPILVFGQTIDRDVLSSAGDTFEEGDINLSWTLGELATETFSVGSIILTQGFQQGNLNVTATSDKELDFALKVYPNPVTDLLIIEIQEPDVFYQIVDASGKVIKNGNITSDLYTLDFTDFPSGIYFLKVEENKTHKIIKK